MRFLNRYAFLCWESELDGMFGIFSNNSSELKHYVATGGVSSTVGRCAYSYDDESPFLLKETFLQYKFFYPFLFTSFWEDYQLGKTIYYHDGSGEWKKVPLDTLVCDQTYWSNDFSYSDEVPPGFVEDRDACTWGQLAEWLVAGCGLVRLPDGQVSRFVDFSADQWDYPVPSGYAVRGFNMTKWVEPTSNFFYSLE